MPGTVPQVKAISSRKRGRPWPVTLGDIDSKVQNYIRALRKAGTPVSANIVIAAAEEITAGIDRTLRVLVYDISIMVIVTRPSQLQLSCNSRDMHELSSH